MKKFFLLFFGLAAMLIFGACSSDETGNDTPASIVTTNPYNNQVKGTLTKTDRPAWTQVKTSSYGSMCLLIDECGIPAPTDSADMMAAFINGACYGLSAPLYDEGEKYWRFNLAVNAPDEQSSSLTVELRYYSAKNAGIYTAATFTYEEGAVWGKYGRGFGYVPEWK